jgi:Carboxypeptidase regulatory-like domain
MRKFTFSVMALGVILSCLIAIYAQTTGSMSGTITDPNGAIVAGATVTLKNDATGYERRATTNDKGGFAFTSLQPGIYSVTVENSGFKKAIASNITVQVSVDAAVNIPLEVGQATETVTVAAGQEVINTSSPTLTFRCRPAIPWILQRCRRESQ